MITARRCTEKAIEETLYVLIFKLIDSCQDIDQYTFQLTIGSKSSTFELKYIYRSFLSVPT